MTLIKCSKRKLLLAGTGLLSIIFAGLAQTASAAGAKYGYPVCLYEYENAFLEKKKDARTCFTLGGHGDKAMGGGDGNFRNISKHYDAFKDDVAVQYIDVKNGYTVKLFYKDSNGKNKTKTVSKDSPINIGEGKLRAVRSWKTKDKIDGYPVCLYESKFSLKKKNTKHALCLPFGEYRYLDAYGWDNKLKYIDIGPKYKVTLYQGTRFDGESKIMESDGKVTMEGFNKSVSSLRISRK